MPARWPAGTWHIARGASDELSGPGFFHDHAVPAIAPEKRAAFRGRIDPARALLQGLQALAEDGHLVVDLLGPRFGEHLGIEVVEPGCAGILLQRFLPARELVELPNRLVAQSPQAQEIRAHAQEGPLQEGAPAAELEASAFYRGETVLPGDPLGGREARFSGKGERPLDAEACVLQRTREEAALRQKEENLPGLPRKAFQEPCARRDFILVQESPAQPCAKD